MKRRFRVAYFVSAEIEVDDAVFKAVDDSWRKQFYDLREPEQVVEHIAGNMLARADLGLSDIDGYANLDDAMAVWVDEPEWDVDEISEVEPKTTKKTKTKRRKTKWTK